MHLQARGAVAQCDFRAVGQIGRVGKHLRDAIGVGAMETVDGSADHLIHGQA